MPDECAAGDACGTRLGYRRGGRCTDCASAEASYRALRRRMPAGYVPTGMVRKHVLALHDEAMSYREIARRAGVDVRTVHRIAIGDVARCTATNRDRILGVIGCSTGDKSVTTGLGFDDDLDLPPLAEDPLASLRLLLSDPEELAWKTDAECRPDRLQIPSDAIRRLFFPRRGDPTTAAAAICGRCPVWAPCLTFALRGEEGIWGRTAGSHRRELVHHGITVDELRAAGMDAEPGLAMATAIRRVLDGRAAVAS